VAPPVELQSPLKSACSFEPKVVFCSALINRRPWNVHLPSDFVQIFVNVQSTQHDCRWAYLQVRFIPKFWRANWLLTAAVFSTFCHASRIYFSQQPVHASRGQRLLGKLFQRKAMSSNFSRSSLPILRILNKTSKRLVTYYGRCTWLWDYGVGVDTAWKLAVVQWKSSHRSHSVWHRHRHLVYSNVTNTHDHRHHAVGIRRESNLLLVVALVVVVVVVLILVVVVVGA